MWQEFKKFALKGNVLDLAVGVIIGGAFNKIVSSLVADIIMPILGLMLGEINISEQTKTVGSAIIKYGMFIQNILDFLIIAFSVFIFIKTLNKLSNLRKTPEKKPAVVVEAKLTKEEVLLTEIRDLLKNKE